MAPRGLKSALKKSAPAALSGTGKFKAFTVLRQGKKTGVKLRGLTKRLEKKLWSVGSLPTIATRSGGCAGGHWKGKNGGRKRGTKVDSQLTRLINAGPAAMRKAAHVYRLTKMVLSGLHARNLEPVLAQRAVVSESARIGTAADVIALDTKKHRLVVVELKCGYSSGRTAAAVCKGKLCKMQAPLRGASDCNLHRHLAQLAVTRELFVREKKTLARVGELGVQDGVDAVLMYADDNGVEFHSLEDWWVKRAPAMLLSMA